MRETNSTYWLCRFIDRISRPAVLAVIMCVYLVFPLFLFPNATSEFKQMPLDLMFAYTPEQAYAQLTAFGPEGREHYAHSTITVDFAYPIVYTLMFCVWLTLLFRNSERFRCTVIMLPLAIFTLDIMENSGILIMLANYPSEYYWLALATSVATTLKWLCVAPTVLLAIGMSGWRALQYFRAR